MKRPVNTALAIMATTLLGAHPAYAQDAQIEQRLAAAQARLAAIEERSTAIHDVNEIENLQRSFGFYFDKMLWDHVADLFADDGTIELGLSGVYIGRDRVRDYLYSLSGGRQGPLEGVLYNHMQLQPIVTVSNDGRSAQARWRALVLTGSDGSGSGGNWGEGPYENTYVKEDGVWKIQSIRWYGNFIAPYEGGWIEVDEAYLRAHPVSPTLQPDAPPTGDYEPFPAASIPPFHFDNPGR
ncbi:MAG TPA: nuclear transport factor 2 family protein [Gammaproteobacteria bacterium]|nr:nuclear transport factor 2 family protein [Gammaproteobacteria bacterium]